MSRKTRKSLNLILLRMFQLSFLSLLLHYWLISSTCAGLQKKPAEKHPVVAGKCYDPLQQRYLEPGDVLLPEPGDCSETVCTGTVRDPQSGRLLSQLRTFYCPDVEENPNCPRDKTAPYPMCCPGGPCGTEKLVNVTHLGDNSTAEDHDQLIVTILRHQEELGHLLRADPSQDLHDLPFMKKGTIDKKIKFSESDSPHYARIDQGRVSVILERLRQPGTRKKTKEKDDEALSSEASNVLHN
ncbi:uncharacterized protein [Anabrus simplex]|uniref:uncharacterized protein n=1 Tax=Anabrus simplex TaxID=316456 RepID=UPI0035A27184